VYANAREFCAQALETTLRRKEAKLCGNNHCLNEVPLHIFINMSDSIPNKKLSTSNE
jgi:hypothetical protein